MLLQDAFGLLLSLVCLHLSFQHCTPLIYIAVGVCWVVTLLVLVEVTDFVLFVIQVLLDSEGVELERVDLESEGA